MDRPSYREEMKYRLDIVKTAVSIIGLASIFVAAITFYNAYKTSQDILISNLQKEWKDQLQIFISHPEVLPYFKAGKKINKDDPNSWLVYAIAHWRLDSMENMLQVSKAHSNDAFESSKTLLLNEFRLSPAMCILSWDHTELEAVYNLQIAETCKKYENLWQ